MLHTKFRNHRPGTEEEYSKSFFAVYSHGVRLSHVTLKMYTNFHLLFPRMSRIYYGHIQVYRPGAGADNPLGPKYFHKHKSSVHLLFHSKFSAIK